MILGSQATVCYVVTAAAVRRGSVRLLMVCGLYTQVVIAYDCGVF